MTAPGVLTSGALSANIEMSGGTRSTDENEVVFLMKTYIIRWQRAAIVSGAHVEKKPLSICAVPPEHPGDNGGSLLFIVPNSRGHLLQWPRISRSKAREGLAWESLPSATASEYC